jgi:phosphoadenosine phosphosulfate reductase
MYNYVWDAETGGYLLDTKISGVTKELRPVFHEELDLLGFGEYWQYVPSEKPFLWAETRRYFYKGELVAEANGGGLFTKPTLKVHKFPLQLEPVNVEEMVRRNSTKMAALIQHTVELIYNKYNEYKDKVDVIYVAFSGGKDSIVLLDLVQKTLPNDGFKVVFSDTTMEVSDTYNAVEEAVKIYPNISFHVANAHFDAVESWHLFGTPSRTLRWCCAVHKSVPSLLKLREIIGQEKLRALALDGVRAEESEMRAAYLEKGGSSKHSCQVNEHPISVWNAAEVFLYIISNNLLYNNAYRYGSSRVGCLICPLSSEWREFITNAVYPTETNKFLKIINEGLSHKIPDITERTKYIEYGGWKGRIDGRDFVTDGNRIIEAENDAFYSFSILGISDDFFEWLKPIGRAITISDEQYVITYKGTKYLFSVQEIDNGITVSIDKQSKTQNYVRFIYLLKNVLHKTAYCGRCGFCKVTCQFGALNFMDNKVKINNECCNCEQCIDMPRGCLIAKSKLFFSGGKNVMIKGLGNYRGFGFDKTWLDYYFELGDGLWASGTLGKPKYDALKLFLREAEITESNLLTVSGQELKRIKTSDVNCWAVVLVNLSYNSSLVKWYILNVPFDTLYTPNEIKILLGERYTISTKDNAVDTLMKTFRYSPIGGEIGVGRCKFKGNSVSSLIRGLWSNPDPLVILYSLFKFSEKCDGHYGFTLSYLCDDSVEREGISPSRIFGISPEVSKEILISLSRNYSDFISVEFQKDLDNIDLNRDKTALDVLKLL